MLQRKEIVDYKDYSYNDEKKEKNDNNKIMFKLYLFCIVVIAIMLSFYIIQSVTINHLSYKVNELESELNSLERKNQKLELQSAKRLSLSNIEKIAKNKLGMVESNNSEYVVLNNKSNSNKEENIINKNNEGILTALYNFFDNLETVKASSP